MAAEEVGLAERFAAELEAGLHAQGGGAGTAPGVAAALPGQAPAGAAPTQPLGNTRLPGLGAARVAIEQQPAQAGQHLTAPAGGPTSPAPLGGLPGVPAAPRATP